MAARLTRLNCVLGEDQDDDSVLAGVLLATSTPAHRGTRADHRPYGATALPVTHTASQTLSYLDAMKGVMSSSRGKDTYVVIFRLSLAECSNRCRNWGEGREGRG